MGNRAVITTRKNFENNGVGVYLHWNGGRDSVGAFLKYCELKGYRSPSEDNYGWARLCQVIGNFFGGTTSIGIDVVSNLDTDNYDNGTYIIEGWKIVDRKYFSGWEQDSYSMEEMLQSIDELQPEGERLGDYLKAIEIPTEKVKLGDMVCFINWNGELVKGEVVGFGEDKIVNGAKVRNMPYLNLYGDKEKGYDWNINNYIQTKTARVLPKEREK